MKNETDRIRVIYADYLAAAKLAEEKQKPTDGIFGMGKKAADDPCHTAFIDTLKTALDEIAQQKPDSGTVREILSYICRMPLEYPSPVSIYWMLIAAQGLTKDLIPFLSQTDAAALADEFGKQYGRWERLPVQKELFRALQKASKK